MQLKAIVKNIAKEKKISAALVLQNYNDIMKVVKNSSIMKLQWNDYRKEFDFANGIEFESTCEAVVSLMNQLSE